MHPDGDVIVVRMSATEEIPELHALTVHEIGPSVASCETMQRVHKHNPECLWTILRRPAEGGADRLVGYFGFLHLNTAGLEALQNRTLSGRTPDLNHLACAGERPAALYVWAGHRAKDARAGRDAGRAGPGRGALWRIADLRDRRNAGRPQMAEPSGRGGSRAGGKRPRQRLPHRYRRVPWQLAPSRMPPESNRGSHVCHRIPSWTTTPRNCRITASCWDASASGWRATA